MVGGQLEIMYIHGHFDGTKYIHDEEDELFKLN